MIGLIVKYIWLLGIIVELLNLVFLRIYVQRHINAKPKMKGGYNYLLSGIYSFKLIPWIVMGTGITFGGVPNILHFFNPNSGNAFVVSFYVFIALILFVEGSWLFFCNGASTLVKYQGIISYVTFGSRRREIRSAHTIKSLWLIQTIGFGVFMYLIWFTNYFNQLTNGLTLS